MQLSISPVARHRHAPGCSSQQPSSMIRLRYPVLKRIKKQNWHAAGTAQRANARADPQAQAQRDTTSHPAECSAPVVANSNSTFNDMLLAAAACTAAFGFPSSSAVAAADEMAAYDNSAGSKNLKNIFGVGYVLLVAYFAIRLLTKRAKNAKTERIAGSSDSDTEADLAAAAAEQQRQQLEAQQEANASPVTALIGAAQAAFFATVLWTLTSGISGFFDARELPDNYTARNITVTIKTVVEGLAYLLTFIFGANAVGLTALAVQLAFFPDTLNWQDVPKAKDVNALPKISLTDDIYSIRKAFEEVQQAASKDPPSSGGGSNQT